MERHRDMAENVESSPKEWTIGRLLAWTTEHFRSHGLAEPRLAAEILLAEALNRQRIELYARFDEAPSEQQRAVFRESVRLAVTHKPIAYLVGHREFYSLDFIVREGVLIPRPETELLVELALDWCKARAAETHHLLDIGTGTGCIAITIAKRASTVHAVGTDRSAAALAVAGENVKRHGVADRVQLIEADMLALPPEAIPEGGFHLIVSNPPYIGERERETLPKNVVDHEPAEALFAGEDGLDAYRQIADGVHRLMRPGGVLLLEVGYQQAEAVRTLMTDAGHLDFVSCHKDLSGIDRALQFTLPA